MIKRFHSNLFRVSDLEKTFEFYSLLGFEPVRAEGAVRIKIGDFTFAFMGLEDDDSNTQQEKGVGVSSYVEVLDVDEYFEFLSIRGVPDLSLPVTQPWGKRELMISDPDGFKLVFYSGQ